MRSVVVHEDAGFIVMIVGVATDVMAPFDNQAGFAKLGGNAFGQHCAGKTGAYNEKIKFHLEMLK